MILKSVFCIFLTIQIIEPSVQNKFLKNYSELKYDKDHLSAKHSRVQRSLDSHISLIFEGHGRKFNIKMKPSNKNYYETNIIDFNGEQNLLEPIINYEGRLEDAPDASYVLGSITDGIFIGLIETDKGKYYIEPAKRYFNTTNSHSIIYHENDVILDSLKESEQGIGCGLSDYKVKKQLDIEQKHNHEDLLFKYTKEANEKHSSRIKRQAGQLTFPSAKSVCSLYLIADPFYYDKIFNNEGRKDATITLNYIRNYFNSYVSTLNSVFNPLKLYTDSAQTSYYSGVQFRIYKTKVITFDNCNAPSSTLSDAEKQLCLSNLDVVTFLSNVALQNHDSYCLAYAFTARDFSNGALGLAYVGSSNGGAGGICQKNTDINSVKKSLNTGVVTIINYGSRVVDLVSQISFLHEVGHSFGANHDPVSCQPGDSKGGNYIMYFSASSGTKANNKVFSSCSIGSMGPIFNFVLTNNNCLQSSTAPICGNGILETNETCDCGFLNDCTDTCCNATTCQLKSTATCSPSQGACCESDCTFSQPSKVCSTITDCTSSAFCTGTSAVCPSLTSGSNTPDLTACNGGTQVCISGQCIGSICQRYNLTQCYLSGDLTDSTVDKFSLCHLACTGVATSNVCTDSFNITKILSDINTGIVLKPGSVCDNNLGYCDALSKCRQANLDNLVSKLISSLLTPAQTIQDIKNWVKTYWWAVLIFVIIFLVLFLFTIYCLSRLLPTSNPNRNLKDINKKKKKEEETFVPNRANEFRRRSQIFTTEISDNVDYEKQVPRKKNSKPRILV